MLAACQAELGQLGRALPNIARPARDNPRFTADRLPPMLASHPDPAPGARRMQLLRALWLEVSGGFGSFSTRHAMRLERLRFSDEFDADELERLPEDLRRVARQVAETLDRE